MTKLFHTIIRGTAYRFRWLVRFYLCRYANCFSGRRVTPSMLITLHENQRKRFCEQIQRSDETPEYQVHNRLCAEIKLNLIEPTPSMCLEIGCESGWFGIELLKKFGGCFYAGIDIQREKLVRTGDSRAWLLQAQAEYLPFTGIRFDLVVALHVIEHIRDVRRFSKELERITVPGAYILVALPLGYDTDPCHRWHFMSSGGWKRFLYRKYGFVFVRGTVTATAITEFVALFKT